MYLHYIKLAKLLHQDIKSLQGKLCIYFDRFNCNILIGTIWAFVTLSHSNYQLCKLNIQIILKHYMLKQDITSDITNPQCKMSQKGNLNITIICLC